ncbi:UPF0711 protein C18orf21 homolog isoform X1 [Mobula birostris]|uniref:UPF0711 protein C18orf21 homolog isoform X1 n=1 Tax=Mobula birostris TaxID=1983395 RepID=UPI003B27DB11
MDNLKRLQFLKNSAFQLKETCPAVASFLLWTHSCIPDGKIKSSGVCKHCFQILHPENHRVRLKSKKKITTQTRKLLQRKAANWKLTLKQLRKLWKYEKSQNKLLVTCYTCKETSRFNGARRRSLAVRPHIPRSLTKTKTDIKTLEGRRMPQSTEKATKYSPHVNKLSSEIKSPAITPRIVMIVECNTPKSHAIALTGFPPSYCFNNLWFHFQINTFPLPLAAAITRSGFAAFGSHDALYSNTFKRKLNRDNTTTLKSRVIHEIGYVRYVTFSDRDYGHICDQTLSEWMLSSIHLYL